MNEQNRHVGKAAEIAAKWCGDTGRDPNDVLGDAWLIADASISDVGQYPNLRSMVQRIKDPDRIETIEVEDVMLESPHEAAERDQTRRVVRMRLLDLNWREERVLRLRYGMEPLEHGAPTLDEVGEDPGLRVSKERIRQLERQALRRLAHPNHRRFLEMLLDETYYREFRRLNALRAKRLAEKAVQDAAPEPEQPRPKSVFADVIVPVAAPKPTVPAEAPQWDDGIDRSQLPRGRWTTDTRQHRRTDWFSYRGISANYFSAEMFMDNAFGVASQRTGERLEPEVVRTRDGYWIDRLWGIERHYGLLIVYPSPLTGGSPLRANDASLFQALYEAMKPITHPRRTDQECPTSIFSPMVRRRDTGQTDDEWRTTQARKAERLVLSEIRGYDPMEYAMKAAATILEMAAEDGPNDRPCRLDEAALREIKLFIPEESDEVQLTRPAWVSPNWF